MKLYEAPSFVFNYAFNSVCAVFYDRYPNSFAKHVISEDVLSREITRDKIYTRKLIVKKGASFLKSVPKWLSKYVTFQYMPTLEESIYDKTTSTLTTYTRNVSWKSVVAIDEYCVYRPLDNAHTELLRRMTVGINYGHISSIAERFLVMAVKKSTRKTVDGYLEKLHERFGPPAPSISTASGGASVRSISDKIRSKKIGLDKM